MMNAGFCEKVTLAPKGKRQLLAEAVIRRWLGDRPGLGRQRP
jgi:hypothetical protein